MTETMVLEIVGCIIVLSINQYLWAGGGNFGLLDTLVKKEIEKNENKKN